MADELGVVRGQVVRIRLSRGARGSDQRGARYGVVVQVDELLGLSTILVSPTSTSAPASTFRPVVDVNGVRTRVLADQTRALSRERIGASAGRLNSSELRALDDALELVFGL